MKPSYVRTLTALPDGMTSKDAPRVIDDEVIVPDTDPAHAGTGWGIVAASKCKTCHGTGIVPLVQGKDEGADKRAPRLDVACNCVWEAVAWFTGTRPAVDPASPHATRAELEAAVIEAEDELTRMALIMADQKARLRVENRGLARRFEAQRLATEELQGALVALQEAEAQVEAEAEAQP